MEYTLDLTYLGSRKPKIARADLKMYPSPSKTIRWSAFDCVWMYQELTWSQSRQAASNGTCSTNTLLNQLSGTFNLNSCSSQRSLGIDLLGDSQRLYRMRRSRLVLPYRKLVGQVGIGGWLVIKMLWRVARRVRIRRQGGLCKVPTHQYDSKGAGERLT